MVIYHLQGYVHTRQYGELCERYCHFGDVFSSLELAIEGGKREMNERIEKLLENDKSYRELGREVFIKEVIAYSFEIFEFDPLRREQNLLRTDAESITLENSVEFSDVVEWEFDYGGNLRCRIEWRGSGYERMPGDYAEDAGTQFQKGDFVTLKESAQYLRDRIDEIFVVGGVPGRRNAWHNPLGWENIYAVYCQTDENKFSTGDHDHIHEYQIELYRGELPADSFLQVMAEFFRGERELSEATKCLLWSGKEIYVGDLKQHYKFIEGLQPLKSV